MPRPDWWPPEITKDDWWRTVNGRGYQTMIDDAQAFYEDGCKAMAKALLERLEAVGDWMTNRDSVRVLIISEAAWEKLRKEALGE